MYSQQQQRYLAEAVETASPAARLVMIYDRFVLDLERAEKACLSGDVALAHETLVHAQQIVTVLDNTLDTSGTWNGAQNLHELYEYLYQELVSANLEKSPLRVGNCLAVVRPLAASWREAATILAQQEHSLSGQHSGVA
jgi:flagellar protein FliS